ncbi:STAS domain-containing protein [Ketogulonicigenium vulgare]|uniref:MlaB-like STAS domain-containing protein n=1 Tax=Ketogulonicigenium vulgare (strain WSH-001) TaxID=759362 RepID=F9Y7G2_KETVW|nr:STAS domain-containing protein [Ketogulonicigenium vulgare]ADO42903.1 virus protein [Ketogulonicigenium vulgare Y25]AEM41090.1 hypothetical protein KVU_1251 [Ketogulonicigenium vulgare WSH-001]ALJ81232.1 hypothetical protein KVH_08600 [Ketogulonicigenium vulgare]AOZ54813.1 virus protein [Ketogulonicigenium vulgare]
MTLIALPETIDRSAARALADHILQHRGGPVQLDAGAVTRIGGLGAEVLLAAQRQWQVDGQDLQIINWTPAGIAALALLGAEVLQ